MAHESFTKLEEQVKCPYCERTYQEPRELECYHIYCQKCLERLVLSPEGQKERTVACPRCQVETTVPSGGVGALRTPVATVKLIEVAETFRDSFIAARKLGVDTKGAIIYCYQHTENLAGFFCKSCLEPVCAVCIKEGAKHSTHSYEPYTVAYRKCREDMAKALPLLKAHLAALTETLVDVRAQRRRGIAEEQAAIEARIHADAKALEDALRLRQRQLVRQLNRITQEKLEALAEQRREMEATQAQLSGAYDFVMASAARGETTLGVMTAPLDPDSLRPKAEADIIFEPTVGDITTIAGCLSYGKVISLSSPNPAKCLVSGDGTEVAVVGEKSTVVIHAVNYKGEACRNAVKSFECEILSEITEKLAQGTVERKGESQYEISYQPTIKGRHQLRIFVQEEHIVGSPFCLYVKSPVEKLGAPILSIDGVKNPWGVAISRRGYVVVTEYDSACVSVFGISGFKHRTFGSDDSENQHLRDPRGITVDSDGNILVADSGNHRIVKFTEDGQFLQSSTDVQFQSLMGVAYNPDSGKVYVVDGDTVRILNSDLTGYGVFGERGSDLGQFTSPMGVACDSTGKVYVADSGNHRVQVFTAEGQFVRTIGTGEEGDEEGLNWPAGVAVDNSGVLYVSDFKNCRVSVFSPEGWLLRGFGAKGEGPEEFRGCCGVTVDRSGVLFVCDSSNSRVQLY